jgi:hypothetical protein
MPRNYNPWVEHHVHICSMETTNHESSLYVNFTSYFLSWLIAVVGRSLAGIASSNPTGGHGCLSVVNIVCCAGRGLGRADHSSRGSPAECVSLSMIRCNNIPLHLQCIGRGGPTKSKIRPHSAVHLSTPIACRRCFFQLKTSVLLIHLVVCLTTGPKPLPRRALHIVRSRASSFKWDYPLLSLRSSNSFLRFIPVENALVYWPKLVPGVYSASWGWNQKLSICSWYHEHLECASTELSRSCPL